MDDKRELARERFGAFAQNYVNSAVHGSGYTLERLAALVEPGPGKRALDIATGGGHVALALAKAGALASASDLTPSMLRAARNHFQGVPAAFVCVESGHFPFPDQALDIVTCRLAAHHFPDVPQFVRECVRVLHPGGLVGIVDQIGPAEPEAARYLNTFERLRDPSHGWQYGHSDWESFFEGAGLRLRVSEVANIRLDFDWWTRMQKNDAETVIRLEVMIKQAPRRVAEWLVAEMPERGSRSFAHYHLILVGEKM